MVDASHGNSNKDHRRQPDVAHALGEQVKSGSQALFGIMMESFLVEGRQELTTKSKLKYGQSVTDACMSWKTTVEVLKDLAWAVKKQR